MRIDWVNIKNFRGFAEQRLELHPQFNLLVGDNGSGKTTALEAVAVALGIWHAACPSGGWRNILESEIRMTPRKVGDKMDFKREYPVEISAGGIIFGEPYQWTRAIRPGQKRTSNAQAKGAISAVLTQVIRDRISGGEIDFPVLAYYGAGRAWLPARERVSKVKPDFKKSNRFDAYYYCLDGRIRDAAINEWFMWERLAELERMGERTGFEAVKDAALQSVPGARSLWFDADRKEIVLGLDHSEMPYYSLSDGQRMLFSLATDLAIKAVTLNPSFASHAVSP